jgi:16S rRNA (cytosine1402-N4)-methyltransferase
LSCKGAIWKARPGGAAQRGFDFDGVVLDIGVSSMQIGDSGARLSFQADGPLDMRAWTARGRLPRILSIPPGDNLGQIFYHFGEERASRRIAHAIVTDRATAPFTSTTMLASMIARVAPGKTGRGASGDARVPGAAHRGQR